MTNHPSDRQPRACRAAAIAQSQTPTTSQTALAVNTEQPIAGKNSFTEAQAKSLIEEAGYADLAGLTVARRSGSLARQRFQGRQVPNVSLDFQGNATLAK